MNLSVKKVIALVVLLSSSETWSKETSSHSTKNAKIENSYPEVLTSVQKNRDVLALEWKSAKFEKDKSQILVKAKERFYSELVDVIFPRWMGTKWDFNGISEKPRSGKIACGYFVSTTLRDLGIRLNRYRVAQLYSHDVVKKLANGLKTYSSVSEVVSAIDRRSGTQLYLVGLDQHVGFLVKTRAGVVNFVHSSYGRPDEVVSEPVQKSEVFAQSKKFLLGSVTENEELIKKWLLKEKI